MADLPIVYPSDPSFEAQTWDRVYNHRRALSASASASLRQPAAVVRARSVEDVVAAVRLAREKKLRVSVRSGGHSWAVWSVRRGAILIDLRGLTLPSIPASVISMDERKHWKATEKGGEVHVAGDHGIVYDEATGIVSCGPSTRSGELNKVLGQLGRFFPGGHHPDVGLGGFLLQGGMGWNAKGWGWGCESVVALDVVTADGRVVRCSKEKNEDLFWAARGAGPGFPGVVTRFHLQTRPRRGMWQSVYLYRIEEFTKVLAWVIEVAASSDPDVEVVCVAMCPEGSTEQAVLANFLAFKDSVHEAEAALFPLHDSRPEGRVLKETLCVATDMESQYVMQRLANPEGHRVCCDDLYVRQDFGVETIAPPITRTSSKINVAATTTTTPSPSSTKSAAKAVASLLAPAFTSLPTPKSSALYFSMAPSCTTARSRPCAEYPPMALSVETDHYVALYGVWEDAADDARCADWVASSINSWVAAGADGGSYLGDADFRVRKPRFWSEEAARRLREVRRKWDPEGRICGFLVDETREGRADEGNDGDSWINGHESASE